MAWKETDKVYTYDIHSGPTVVFAGDTTSGGPPNYAPGMWHTIDLKPLGVSADATFAEINGFLIITDVDPDIDNLTATFRAPGSTLHEGNYQMQAISVFSGDGARQVQSVTVALVNGCFQFYWQKTVGGVPENGSPSSFLLNLRLAKWGVDAPDGQDLSADISALQTRVSALEAAPPPADHSAAIAALQTAVAALTATVNGLSDQASAVADLQARVAALETAPPPPSTPTVISVPPEGMTIQFVQQAA